MLAEREIINFDHKSTALHVSSFAPPAASSTHPILQDLRLRFAHIIADRGGKFLFAPSEQRELMTFRRGIDAQAAVLQV